MLVRRIYLKRMLNKQAVQKKTRPSSSPRFGLPPAITRHERSRAQCTLERTLWRILWSIATPEETANLFIQDPLQNLLTLANAFLATSAVHNPPPESVYFIDHRGKDKDVVFLRSPVRALANKGYLQDLLLLGLVDVEELCGRITLLTSRQNLQALVNVVVLSARGVEP